MASFSNHRAIKLVFIALTHIGTMTRVHTNAYKLADIHTCHTRGIAKKYRPYTTKKHNDVFAFKHSLHGNIN